MRWCRCVYGFLLMHPRLFLTFLCCIFASCAAPGGGGSAAGTSAGRDPLGHRPGPRGFRTVILDAGHGGKDSGAISAVTGSWEKDLALDTARRVRSELGGDFRVIMMRDSDEFIDLDERVARASRNGGAVMVSIHFNSGPSGQRGAETFFWRVDSSSLARRVQARVASVAGSARGTVRRRIRLTRNPEIPCILTECGYLSHPVEARRCADPGYRQQLAHAIASGIREQAARGDDGMGPLPPPLNEPLSRASDPRE